MARKLLTMSDVHENYGIQTSTLRHYRHQGIGPKSFKLEGRVVYLEEDVEAWIDEQYKAATTSQPA